METWSTDAFSESASYPQIGAVSAGAKSARVHQSSSRVSGTLRQVTEESSEVDSELRSEGRLDPGDGASRKKRKSLTSALFTVQLEVTRPDFLTSSWAHQV